MTWLPKVWFGSVDESGDPSNSDWEGFDPGEDDDEHHGPTDPDVIAMLGFDPQDPKEWEEYEAEKKRGGA